MRGRPHKLVSISVSVVLLVLAAGCASHKQFHPLSSGRYSVEQPEFRKALGEQIRAPVLEGNKIVALHNGDRFFPAMLDAVRSAEHSITFENFVWRPGVIGDAFLGAFVERAQAGVKVHIILDALGSWKLRRSAGHTLRAAGVEVTDYNAPTWRNFIHVNHRTHRRLLIIDGRVGFIGGVSLADPWMGDGRSPPNWRDTQYRVEGPIVAQMQEVFLENWTQESQPRLTGPAYFPPLTPAGDSPAHCFKSGPHAGTGNARSVYLEAIASARRTIRIAQSYFLPDPACMEALLAARRRGVDIEVIVPGVVNIKIVRRASRAQWGPLLDAGVRIYEYQPTKFHCKVMIVDDAWVTCGSINLDRRSFDINDEANLNVWNSSFVQEQVATFEEDKAHAREVLGVEFKKRSWLRRLSDGIAALFSAQL